MRSTRRAAGFLELGCILVLCGCVRAGNPPAPPHETAASARATFDVADAVLPDPLIVVAYGDMRFTDPRETAASQPRVRQALIERVAAENPAALFLNGDLPWHGTAADYEVYRAETAVWRGRHLRVFPALGNHELAQCAEPQCLELWWGAFPELRGRRWYSVKLGSRMLGIALDSDSELTPGSAQRAWLESQVAALAGQVRVVLIVLHHPPVADIQTVRLVDHNPRPNEIALADYLESVAPRSPSRFVVSAGHIHNYERFERNGIVYLVSGGGGAQPYEVDRTAADLYPATDFPNYHYVRFTLAGPRLVGEMFRLRDIPADQPAAWDMRDRWEIVTKLTP